jgi:ubiquinone/menaquinone biosynthesis C-methylase UbiE
MCRNKLTKSLDKLFCNNCLETYPIVDEIPIFIPSKIQSFWDEVTKKREHIYRKPLFTNDTYCKYAETSWVTVLDLGCGDGNMSAPLADKVDEIFCVDPSLLALQRLKKRNKKNMFPINACGESLPFPNNFFDGVFNIYVIEHISEPLKALEEIRRVLKPTGHLVIVTDSKYYYRYLRVAIEYIKCRKYRRDDVTHVNLMTPRNMRKLLRHGNFFTEKEDLLYYLQKNRTRYIPRVVADPFLTSVIIHKCRPIK